MRSSSIEEHITDAESLASHKGPKGLGAWVDIAWGLCWLRDGLLDEAEIEEDDDTTTNVLRDPEFRAAMEATEKQLPTLIKYLRTARRYRALVWLQAQSSITRWAMAHPELEKKLANTTPEAIQALYRKMNGGDEWDPTPEQLALVIAKEDAEDEAREAKQKLVLGDIDERIKAAEDVVSYKPRPR